MAPTACGTVSTAAEQAADQVAADISGDLEPKRHSRKMAPQDCIKTTDAATTNSAQYFELLLILPLLYYVMIVDQI